MHFLPVYFFCTSTHIHTYSCDQTVLLQVSATSAFFFWQVEVKGWGCHLRQSDMAPGSANCWSAGLVTVSRVTGGASCPGTLLQGPPVPRAPQPCSGVPLASPSSRLTLAQAPERHRVGVNRLCCPCHRRLGRRRVRVFRDGTLNSLEERIYVI